MNTFSKISFAVAMLAVATSCSDKLSNDVATPYFNNSMSLTASSKNSRSMLNDDLSVYWSNGDEIAVSGSDDSGVMQCYATSAIGDEGAASAIFTGNAVSGEDIYAFYPYDMATAISDAGVVSLTIPSTQSRVAERPSSFANGAMPAYATAENGTDLTFTNICGMLRFKLTSADGVTVSKVVVSSENDFLSGAATYDGSTLSVTGEKSVSLAFDAVTLSETAQEFSIVLPPTTSALTIELFDGTTSMGSKTLSKTISANTATDITSVWEVVNGTTPSDSETIAITDISATNYPATASTWIITGNDTTGDDTSKDLSTFTSMKKLNEALKAAQSEDANRRITLVLQDQTLIVKAAFNALTILEGLELSAATDMNTNVCQNCTNLKSVIAPNMVNILGNTTFQWCNALEVVELPKLEKLPNGTFNNINSGNLKKITIATQSTLSTLGTNVFVADGVKNATLYIDTTKNASHIDGAKFSTWTFSAIENSTAVSN